MNAPLNVASEVLRVSDLRVELAGEVDVLAEVSFSLVAGEIVGLVGESGSGKTTLATALLRHARQGARIVAGQVQVAGQSLLELEGEALRLARGGLVGYVAQDPATALNPALRIGALLGETLLAHQPALSRDAVRLRVGETLRDVGLPDEDAFLRRFPHQLSGGQQQRVMLALAFVLKPKLIVLDEPTTALDVTTQAHVLQTLKRLCRGQGVAALYVTHDLAVVRDLVDRVMVMYAGRLVEVAGREALFRIPAHPYTRALLAAIPDIARRQPLQAIAGHAPAPGQRPDGCAFAPRCAQRRAQCSVIEPSLLAHADGHQVACVVPQQETVALDDVPVETLSAPGDVLLEVQGLDVAYDRQVLFDVSLQVRQGECLALVGESGSGKTSLARAIAGLGENVQGQLRYAGQPLAFAARQRNARLRHQIQYVFQNPYRALNPRQTVGQTLSAPLAHFLACAVPRPGSGSRRCWRGCHCRRVWRTFTRRGFPAASVSAWRLPGR